MKIVIAPNALKGSCTARAAARALARGVRRAAPAAELVEVPVADGGDGLLELALAVLGAQPIPIQVTGPCFTPVQAALAWVPERHLALIEMALASGLALVPATERNPLHTTTLGTGELIRAALDLGAKTLLVGIGGSATTDGGIGMASALGYRFLDAAGRSVPATGAGLAAIARIDGSGVDPRLGRVDLQALCDVDNPLTGPRGAAAVYGPQKGASPEQVARLDAGLAQLASLVAPGLSDQPGAGAAGGLGFGLRAFCGGRLRLGAELVLELLDFDHQLAGADLVLTAEGWLDDQTGSGKAPALVATRAGRRDIPCIVIAGGLGPDLEQGSAQGFTAALSLCPGPMPLAEAMARAEELLAAAAERAVRIFLAGRRSVGSPKPVLDTATAIPRA